MKNLLSTLAFVIGLETKSWREKSWFFKKEKEKKIKAAKPQKGFRRANGTIKQP